MFKNGWENIKAAGIVFLIVLAAFIGYFAMIAGTVLLIAIALFFLIRLLLTEIDDKEEEEK
jgi:hypothetical protein